MWYYTISTGILRRCDGAHKQGITYMEIILKSSSWENELLTRSCTAYISIEKNEGAGVHLQPRIRSDYCVEASLISYTLDRFVVYCNRA